MHLHLHLLLYLCTSAPVPAPLLLHLCTSPLRMVGQELIINSIAGGEPFAYKVGYLVKYYNCHTPPQSTTPTTTIPKSISLTCAVQWPLILGKGSIRGAEDDHDQANEVTPTIVVNIVITITSISD